MTEVRLFKSFVQNIIMQLYLFIFTISAVRLAGGSFSSTGRVEVYYNGTWRTGCDDNWDIYNAGVVCRQLGFRYALDVYQIPRYGKGSGPNLLHHFYCLGYESSLFSCRRSGVGNHNCDHSKNVGVRCGDNGGENN